MALATPSLFVRQTSGLIKEFRPIDVFVFNTVAFALGLVLAITPTFLGGLYPNANIHVVLTLGFILTAFNGLVYGLFSAAMPRSGGDYVFISRTLNPAVGFAANWGFTWSQFLGVGVYAAWCVRDALSPALITLGYGMRSKALIDSGGFVLKPVPMFVIGTLLLASVLVVSLAGTKILKRFLNAFFVVALIGTGMLMWVFLTTSHSEFVAAFNSAMAQQANLENAYAAVIEQARSNGLQTGQPTDFLSALLALPVGYWVFIGVTYSAYVGGEIKEPQKSQTIGILGALVFGYVIYMITMGAYYDVVGRDFNNAVALLQTLEKSPLPTSGSMSFFAGILTTNIGAILLISVSTFLWFFMMLFVMATVCVRNIFAWSFDQLAPERWSHTDRRGAPRVATLVVVGCAELFLAAQVFAGITFMNYIALFSVCFLIAGIAAIVFPYRRKELFEQSPAIVRRRVLGLPLITLAGIGNTVLFLLVLYSALTNNGLSGVTGEWLPVYVLVAIYGSGFLVYMATKAYRARGGVDLGHLYSEIPPE